jgi:hypothetical protein
MAESSSDIVSAVRELAGESLRSVAVYDEDDYVALAERPDVSAQYGSADTDAIYEEMVLEGIGIDYFESLFQTGSIECSTAIFEDAVVMHFTAPNHTGLFLSFDADSSLPVVEIADRCDDWIDERFPEGIPLERF